MVPIKGEQRYFDGYLHSNLEILQEAVRRDFDGVIYLGGYEGNGKSTFAMQCAAAVDPTFCLDRVCFDMKEFETRIRESSPGQAIVLDESWKDVNSGARHAASAQRFIRLLTENRKKRLFIFVVAATFFDINKYLLIHRSRAYIEIYTKGLDRGYFSFYDRERKKDLYIRGKRDWNMGLVPPTFRGCFQNWLPFSKEEYEAKKDKAINALNDEHDKKKELSDEDIQKIRWDAVTGVVEHLKSKRFLKLGALNEVAEYLRVNPRTYRRWAIAQQTTDAEGVSALGLIMPLRKEK